MIAQTNTDKVKETTNSEHRYLLRKKNHRYKPSLFTLKVILIKSTFLIG